MNWRETAACRGHDIQIWFDDYYRSRALAICHKCPVTLPCLAAATATGETEGVWGGLVPNQRARIRNRPWRRALRIAYDATIHGVDPVAAIERRLMLDNRQQAADLLTLAESLHAAGLPVDE